MTANNIAAYRGETVSGARFVPGAAESAPESGSAFLRVFRSARSAGRNAEKAGEEPDAPDFAGALQLQPRPFMGAAPGVPALSGGNAPLTAGGIAPAAARIEPGAIPPDLPARSNPETAQSADSPAESAEPSEPAAFANIPEADPAEFSVDISPEILAEAPAQGHAGTRADNTAGHMPSSGALGKFPAAAKPPPAGAPRTSHGHEDGETPFTLIPGGKPDALREERPAQTLPGNPRDSGEEMPGGADAQSPARQTADAPREPIALSAFLLERKDPVYEIPENAVAEAPAPAAQLSEKVSVLAEKGSGTYLIELTPSGLGKVTVKLDFSGPALELSFAAEHPATQSLLLSGSAEIKSALEASVLRPVTLQSADPRRDAPPERGEDEGGGREQREQPRRGRQEREPGDQIWQAFRACMISAAI